MDLTNLALNVLGFFELDDVGVIRYSSSAARPAGVDCSLVGENFFETADLKNRDELHRHFRQFIASRDAADSFPFDCLFEDVIVHTKVTLTRAFQTELFPPEGIVMLSIRESEQ